MLVTACLLGLLAVACSDGGGGDGDGDTGGGGPGPATSAAAPEGADLRVVSLNVLHGLICPPDTNGCLLPERLALVERLLEEAGCPQVVALQEVSDVVFDLVDDMAPEICEGEYEVVWHGEPSTDRELVLTTLPVVDQDLTILAGRMRSAYRVRLESPLGPLTVIVTHTGTATMDSQGDNSGVCGRTSCEAPCEEGMQFIDCQVLTALRLADEELPDDGVAVVTGDLNVVPESRPYDLVVDEGWTDTFLAAGNAECEPTSGTGCTAGRRDDVLDDLLDPAPGQVERIDYMFLKAPPRCEVTYDTGDDADGDGVATGLFPRGPTPDGPSGLAWPSDHTGTALDLACGKG